MADKRSFSPILNIADYRQMELSLNELIKKITKCKKIEQKENLYSELLEFELADGRKVWQSPETITCIIRKFNTNNKILDFAQTLVRICIKENVEKEMFQAILMPFYEYEKIDQENLKHIIQITFECFFIENGLTANIEKRKYIVKNIIYIASFFVKQAKKENPELSSCITTDFIQRFLCYCNSMRCILSNDVIFTNILPYITEVCPEVSIMKCLEFFSTIYIDNMTTAEGIVNFDLSFLKHCTNIEFINCVINFYKNKGYKLRDILLPILSYFDELKNEDLFVKIICDVIKKYYTEESLLPVLSDFTMQIGKIKDMEKKFDLALTFIQHCYPSDMEQHKKIEYTQQIIEIIQQQNQTLLCATVFNFVNEFQNDEKILEHVSCIVNKFVDKNPLLASSICYYTIASLYSIGKIEDDIFKYTMHVVERADTMASLGIAAGNMSELIENIRKSRPEIKANQCLLSLISSNKNIEILGRIYRKIYETLNPRTTTPQPAATAAAANSQVPSLANTMGALNAMEQAEKDQVPSVVARSYK